MSSTYWKRPPASAERLLGRFSAYGTGGGNINAVAVI
jgi:hypothetical protein